MHKHRIYSKFRELILYGIIGGFSATLDFIVYTLIGLLIPYLGANVISVHCGIICSFILNRQFNFRKKDKTAKRFTSFYVIGLLGLGLSELLIYIMSALSSMDYTISKLITIIVVAIFQFILNKLITFKS